MLMNDVNNIVYGDEKRIFINTALGCNSGCKYCYLSNLGVGKDITYYTAEIAIKKVINMSCFLQGKEGTIISIGCYSECWDKTNKINTIKIIEFFARMGNYVQLATKKKIELEDLLYIDSLLLFKNQLSINVSVPTISNALILEPNADSINERLSLLEYKSKLNKIYISLYIKPVLKDITIKDITQYIDLMEKYNISAVIGELLVINIDEK